jgi:hypothetical protein
MANERRVIHSEWRVRSGVLPVPFRAHTIRLGLKEGWPSTPAVTWPVRSSHDGSRHRTTRGAPSGRAFVSHERRPGPRQRTVRSGCGVTHNNRRLTSGGLAAAADAGDASGRALPAPSSLGADRDSHRRARRCGRACWSCHWSMIGNTHLKGIAIECSGCSRSGSL